MKSFWKTKTIEDQGKKRVQALKDLKPKEQAKAIGDKSDKMFNRWLEKNCWNTKTSQEIDFNNFFYCFKGPNIAPINFVRFRGPLHILHEIKNGDTLKKVEEDQKKFKSSLGEIT